MPQRGGVVGYSSLDLRSSGENLTSQIRAHLSPKPQSRRPPRSRFSGPPLPGGKLNWDPPTIPKAAEPRPSSQPRVLTLGLGIRQEPEGRSPGNTVFPLVDKVPECLVGPPDLCVLTNTYPDLSVWANSLAGPPDLTEGKAAPYSPLRRGAPTGRGGSGF